jgi:hypothetical protein
MDGFRQRFLPALLGLLLAAAPSWSARAQGKTDDGFMQAVTAKFILWDTDYDQTLTVEELDAAIQDPANTGRAAAALAALKRASSSTNYTLPPLTLANIRTLANSPPATNRPNLLGMYRDCLRRVGGVAHRYIFTSGQLFATGLPRLDTIRQGRMGDCFCLAPLGAMVHRDPHEVASLFEVEADGHVLVQFGGGTVRVAAPTDAEFALAMLAANSRDNLWVNLYEKAISEVRNDARSPDKRSNLAIDAIAKGGDDGRVMSYLTGHKVSEFSLKSGDDPATAHTGRRINLAELRQKLAEAAGQKLLMGCGTEETTTPGLTPKHAYALLEYYPKTDSVELWNPHGNNFIPEGAPGLANGYPTRSGLFTVPVTEFVQQFADVSFEDAEFAARQ